MQPVPLVHPLANSAAQTAIPHIRDILSMALQHSDALPAVVVYDLRCELSQILYAAYRHCLPLAQCIHFDAVTSDFILSALASLVPGSLVVLIQSTNFRLEAYRLRVELFKRQLKVIEHPHLGRMNGAEVSRYIDALAYDIDYFRPVGHALKRYIDKAQRGVIDSGEGARLVFDSAFEPAKLNIGDYRDMANVGGQFPIGEVFTEAKNLEAVNGRVRIFMFGDTTFTANKPDQPITLIIQHGKVAGVENSTPEFDRVLQQIREDEGEIWLRELGFGMNRALTAERTVSDIGTYERMCGIHLSLGAKHGVYNKPQIRRAAAKYHVDVFAATVTMQLDDRVVYHNGGWCT